MVEWLAAPLSYAFMQRSMLAGCFVMLRSMAFIGDAIAHAVLPGVAVAYLLKGDLVLAATLRLPAERLRVLLPDSELDNQGAICYRAD